MGKQIRKGQNITPRHTFPITESMSDDSINRIVSISRDMHNRQERNIHAMQRIAYAH